MQADQMITTMFGIQNGLNTKSYDTAWIEKGKTEEFDYMMAAGDEAHEFLRSLPFQWWTKDAPDPQNQVTELVDAWHFVMSQWIIDHDGNVDAAARNSVDLYARSQEFGIMEDTVKKQAKLFVAAAYLHNTRHGELMPGYKMAFFNLCRRANVSLELLYARYIAKSTLNKFRVANGYKLGTYKKIWELGGEKGEDNFFLSRWVDEELQSHSGYVPTEEDVNHFLTRVYAELDNR